MTATSVVELPSSPLRSLTNFVWIRSHRQSFFRYLTGSGDLVRTRIGPFLVYHVGDLDLIKELLVNQSRKVVKGRGLERSKPLLGTGLLTSEGEHHLRQRRLSQPAFHKQRVLGYGAAMVELAERYIATLRPGQSRDLHRDLMKLTLAIVGKTLFDSDIEGDAAQVGHALDAFMDGFPLLMTPGFKYLEKLGLPRIRRLKESIASLDRLIYSLIDERRKSGRDHGDLLSMLITAQDAEGDGRGMSDQQLRDECITLMLAGHETTANALTWTLYLLSQHPGIAARLHAELDEVLGGRPPTPADLPRLVYTEKVFSESLRLYPPAWMLARRAIEPLELAGHTVPKNAVLFISPYFLHRNPRLYPDPERFDPERFTPEARAARHRFAYLPFSSGPRNCIGEGFAWTEGVLLLAVLARRWKYALAPGQRVVPEPLITLRPKYGMRMLVEPR